MNISLQPNLQEIANRSTDGYFRHLFHGGIVFSNRGFSELLKYPYEEFSKDPRPLEALVDSGCSDEVDDVLYRLQQGLVSQSSSVIQLRRADGTPVWTELFVIPVLDKDGEVIGVDGVVRDVSGHLEVADLLSRRTLQLGALLEAHQALAGSLDFEKTLRMIVEQAQSLLDAKLSVIFLLDPESQQLQPLADAGSIAIPTKDLRFMVGEGVSGWVIANAQSQKVDQLSADPRGQRILHRLEADISLLAVPLKLSDQVAGTLTLVGDTHQFDDSDLEFLETLGQVASLALANSRNYQLVEKMATIDGLTGAHNRLFLEESLPEEIERADRLGYPLAVLMVDVDDLKGINDQHGHLKGDEVLKTLVVVLQRCTRETDWVARYGGDEFLVVLPGCSTTNLRRLGEKIQNDLLKTLEEIEFSISIGGAVHEGGKGGTFDLLQRADRAERAAKDQGGDLLLIQEETDLPENLIGDR
ncbi:MAG: diguanylate cyclase domain-containing protein [Anaerolineales bacterium]